MQYIFVTVNYNGFPHTKEFIQSIEKLQIEYEDSIEIYIVDNCSIKKDLNEHQEFIKTKQNIFFIKSNENLGYFGGMNLALEKIQIKNDNSIIICNNDLTFSSDFLMNYKKINYDSDVFLIAPNIMTKNGIQQNPLRIKRLSKVAIFKSDVYMFNYYTTAIIKYIMKIFTRKKEIVRNEYKQRIIESGIGACYIITEHFWEKFNKLDNKVFLWGEEAVLSHQLRQNNGKTLYAPSLNVLHHESASVGLIPSKKKYEILKKSYKIYRKYL